MGLKYWQSKRGARRCRCCVEAIINITESPVFPLKGDSGALMELGVTLG